MQTAVPFVFQDTQVRTVLLVMVAYVALIGVLSMWVALGRWYWSWRVVVPLAAVAALLPIREPSLPTSATTGSSRPTQTPQ